MLDEVFFGLLHEFVPILFLEDLGVCDDTGLFKYKGNAAVGWHQSFPSLYNVWAGGGTHILCALGVCRPRSQGVYFQEFYLGRGVFSDKISGKGGIY